jgi:hypothetical protein
VPANWAENGGVGGADNIGRLVKLRRGFQTHGYGLDSTDHRSGLYRPLFNGAASGKNVRRDGDEEQGTDFLSKHGHFVILGL